ncbi:hypothetical protein DRP53_03165 [candidate division WOR-3 bacterium]|uniref:DUF2007 domain-containing protein n=1 Tax=candidate division WOR-3 bacterium TaxID=2052148 RepID=A0A660SJQ5_UNCW3|nr:MAG: hypothetical protein DRP53_03165 [candidate division WOR-3 bacterium]
MYKRVYVAPDEFTAVAIRDFLENEGIHVMLRRYETSWLDGLPKVMMGGWGEIAVSEDDYEEARRLIEIFLSSNQEI